MRLLLMMGLGLMFGVLPAEAGLFGEGSNYVDAEEGERGLGSLFSGMGDSSAEQWVRAQEKLADKKWRSAGKLLRALYLRWPNSVEAPEAVMAHAGALMERKEWRSAFTIYQFAVDNYANRLTDYDAVLAGQYRAAQEVMEARRLPFLFGGYRTPEMAIPLFEAVILNGPQWEGAPEALMMVGRCNQNSDAFEEAIVAYAELMLRYPEHALAEDAALGRIACLRMLREKFPSSPEILERILTATTVYLSRFPESERRGDIILLRNELYEFQADELFEQGRFYERVARNEVAALRTYMSVLEQYPKSQVVSRAEEQIERLIAKGIVLRAEEPTE
jgi:TolA-binding protein